MKAACAFSAAFAVCLCSLASSGEGVKYRGLFINDEDWGLRPWAVKHFGAEEQIGVGAYAEVFSLMKSKGLNLLWPAMHEGGYEFSSRPENLDLAGMYGIAVGTSHCEPMLRNNCYLPEADKGKWSWTSNRAFLKDYWREGVRRGEGREILWTIGMRGIHDARMPDGRSTEEKKRILEEVFAAQKEMLPDGAPMLFCPYKEVLPIFNAGLKVPAGATIMWVNDNYGYIRRLGGPACEGYGGGIYWHLSYWGLPHGYLQTCTVPPAFMWYELCAKAWNNGARDVWMVNAGDVFQAELLLDCFGRFSARPDAWGPDAQPAALAAWCGSELGLEDALKDRALSHLMEYFNLGFIRKPEHMCVQWTENLPGGVKASLAARYRALLAEDAALEAALPAERRDAFFRTVGFQARFLAISGLVHLEGWTKESAREALAPLYARWDSLDGGKWSGFWIDTLEEKKSKRIGSRHNRWSSQMQWPWNEPPEGSAEYASRREYAATAYRRDVPEPEWLEPCSSAAAGGGAWTRVPGLGTSGRALALLPVKPGAGEGARLDYRLPGGAKTLVLRFLPDFALWPGLGLGVRVSFDGGPAECVAVPKSDSNLGERDAGRQVAVQDNFIEAEIPVPAGAKGFSVFAKDPGVVLDRAGARL
ncbi:MAG: glycosyl hydrolase 115 family protein [Kiritimatiellae bacterium]|nr:glycosyl hydrolase 115 family protein [Kiritimatiellia bacterium]